MFKIKRVLSIALSVFMISGISSTVSAAKTNIQVNGEVKQLSDEPFVENGRTYMPVRYFADALGVKVDWNQSTKTVILEEGSGRSEG